MSTKNRTAWVAVCMTALAVAAGTGACTSDDNPVTVTTDASSDAPVTLGDGAIADVAADSLATSDGASSDGASSDAALSDGAIEAATSDAGDAAAFVDGGCTGGMAALVVMNTKVWCDVSVAGGTASSAAVQTVCVTPGTVNLSASPLSGFKLGPWHHTAGDTGTGDQGAPAPLADGGTASAATVTVPSTGKCVWICCPFTDGTGCPTADQCP